MEEYIKTQLLEGKSDQEICAGILEKFEDQDIDFDVISEKIIKLNRIKKLEDKLKAQKEKEIQDKKTNEEIKKLVDFKVNEKLKSIKLNTQDKYKTPKYLKRFNKHTKMFEDTPVSGECSGQFNNMLRLIADGDRLNAKAISNEIDQENKHQINTTYGIKAGSVRSDDDSSGGYAIPTEMHQEIMQLEYEQSSMLSHMYSDSIIYQDKIYPLMGGVEVKYIESQDSELKESKPMFYQEKIDMERIGLFSNISNTILRQKGVDLTQAFTSAVSSAFATFIDYQIVVGEGVSVTKKLPLGILFDDNTSYITKAAKVLNIEHMMKLKNELGRKINRDRTYWICNYLVADMIGMLTDSNKRYIFNGYIEGRGIKPFSIPIIINNQIPTTFSHDTASGKANRLKSPTGGSAHALMCVDLSKVIIGLSDIRIDESQHVNFTKDMTTFRALRRYGQKIIMGKNNLNEVVSSAIGI